MTKKTTAKRTPKAKAQKVPVTKRALIQRINRKLAPEGRQLKSARGLPAHQGAGHYYIIDVKANFLLYSNVDLEWLGRELKALAPWEELIEEVD